VRVVSNQSEADIRRNQTREDLAWPLRQLTANLLRIVRGAGKPHYLAHQLEACLKVLSAYVEAHGTLPPAHELSEILDPDKAFYDARPWIKENRQNMEQAPGEIEREDAMRAIRRGALQVAASMLLNQTPQQAMGDHEVSNGIRLQEDARAKNAAYYSDPKRRKRSLAETLEMLKRSKK
jgi:hypothetical protein